VTHHGIHADERHPAQNEWGDRRRKIHPADQSTATAPLLMLDFFYCRRALKLLERRFI
jgi:hypothetical protein